ncbi:hypothetical protein KL925_001231 [Ogataea polymorpha]|uniref:Altered inheritance of mitochondria protein 36, mitochondrial n=1 Tax=Ogataea polymorpha TaxID=460523 RepID=A0A9P8T9K1_9ASCO|nr:hypothetical protein KL936_001230 [Ogataea polymorpha]KAG7897053.1 hypothetical protein KL908_000455 [Ogataea polymorpha]KAG7903142.1 hypothetical protein KL935_000674 [Ogataea polymorpha]KAG7912253.1 hypothetical protein KL906_000457 [Ogataea polymorpha]KAG7919984.1 hypothetical protein KL927_000664 [Ogataea polymorpha]
MISFRVLRTATRRTRFYRPLPINTYQKRTYALKETNDPPKLAYFLLVGVFGTLVFVYVANKVNDQDASKSLAKRKNTYTEEEWEQQMNQIKRKQLAFDNSNNFYLVPYGAHREEKVKQLVDTLGPDTATVDLNELIKRQIDDPNSQYGALLGKSLDTYDPQRNTCFYTFTYKLAAGVFTKLVRTEMQRLKAANPQIKNFVILNYPNTMPEAVKFEQDVAIVKNLVLLDDKESNENIVDYFRTVGKVVDLHKLEK